MLLNCPLKPLTYDFSMLIVLTLSSERLFILKLIFTQEFSYITEIIWTHLQTKIIQWVKVSCYFSAVVGREKHLNM